MFLENMRIAAEQVGVLYVMVIIGFICSKTGLYTEKAAKLCTDLLFYIITVAVITESFLEMEFNADTVRSFLIALICNFCMFFFAILITRFIFRSKTDVNEQVFRYAAIYGNCGYMALPLASAILGSEGVFYCSTGVIAFNVLVFTHGVKIMSKDEYKFSLKKLILNPGVIGTLIGFPLFISGVSLPTVLAKPVIYLSGMNTPLAMLIFGTYLANTDLKSMFKEKKIYITALIKLLVIPFAVTAVYRLCGLTGAILTSLTITAASPSANNTIMFAAKYDRDTGLASKTVSMVSVISIITLPVLIAFSQSI